MLVAFISSISSTLGGCLSIMDEAHTRDETQ